MQEFDTSALETLERLAIRSQTPLQGAGGKVAWRHWGSGPPLVLLHGGSGSWRHWARCIPALAATHTVHAPDIPGMGDSDELPAPTTPGLIAKSLADGIEHLLGAGARFDLLGFSFGAAIAGLLALQCGAAVRTLTLIGPGALGLPRSTPKLHDWRGAPDEESARAIHRRNLASLMIADPAKIDEVAVSIQQVNALTARLKSREITPKDALLAGFAQLDPDIVHAIVGERDVVAASHMQERRRFFGERLPPGHFHVVPGSGHWVMHEAPDALMQVLGPILGGRSNARLVHRDQAGV